QRRLMDHPNEALVAQLGHRTGVEAPEVGLPSSLHGFGRRAQLLELRGRQPSEPFAERRVGGAEWRASLLLERSNLAPHRGSSDILGDPPELAINGSRWPAVPG